MDTQYIEFLLMQWGAWSLGDSGASGLSKYSEAPSVVCSEHELAFIDYAVSQLGLKNREGKAMLKFKYLKPEVVDRVAYCKPNSALATKFKKSENQIQMELDSMFRLMSDMTFRA